MPLIDYVAISFLYKNLSIGMSMCLAKNIFLVVCVVTDSIEDVVGGFLLWLFLYNLSAYGGSHLGAEYERKLCFG